MKQRFGRNLCLSLALFALVAQATPSSAFAEARGGSDGGTNVRKGTYELIDFEKVGKRVRIDPRTFEGIYDELQPRLRAIEEKIPGLRKQLEDVLDSRSWFMTDKEFEPRNPDEEKPITQNKDHVLLTAHKVIGMGPEKLRKAWLHEMVRAFVEDSDLEKVISVGSVSEGEQRVYTWLTREEIDQLVESVTVVLYNEYDRPARHLAKLLSDASGKMLLNSGKGFISRPELYQRIRTFQLKEKYQKACQKQIDFSSCKTPMDLDLRIPGKNDRFVKDCVKPTDQKRILTTLNRLRDAKIETDMHSNIPFRVSTTSYLWPDGYDENDYEPINRFWSSEVSLFGNSIGTFEVGISAAISGQFRSDKTHALSKPEKEPIYLNDNDRIAMSILGCSLLSAEDLLLIEAANSAQDTDKESGTENAVRSFAEVAAALGMSNARSTQSDARATTQPVKPATPLTEGFASPSREVATSSIGR